jgi:hypothetical protein
MTCLTAKPIVDGIEKDLQGRAEVVRLNMLTKFGKSVAGRYQVQGLPTTLVINGKGDVTYRHSGLPSRKKIVAQATAS